MEDVDLDWDHPARRWLKDKAKKYRQQEKDLKKLTEHLTFALLLSARERSGGDAHMALHSLGDQKPNDGSQKRPLNTDKAKRV